MRRIIPLVVLGALVAASGSSAAPALTRLRLFPNAVAFLDASHGVLGTGYPYGSGHAGGTIELTSDGGRTWHLVELTPRPVVSLTVSGRAYVARYDDGETEESRDGRHWHPVPLSSADLPTVQSVCPLGMNVGATTGNDTWAVCTWEPGAGNQAKAVYRNLPDRGWVRVAWTGMTSRGRGGISSYGYPSGIAGSDKGFGLLWESRGTLYVTRDGGRDWHALPHVSQPEVDFGSWAYVLPRGGVGFFLVERSGRSRLLETTDAGRTWSVVDRWR